MANAPESDEQTPSAAVLAAGPRWPEGTVAALLRTNLVTEPTRAALRQRLERCDTVEPSFFDAQRFALLRAVCARLLPQTEANPVDIAGKIDARLSAGSGDGWRYASMPPDPIALWRGLDGIGESAEMMFGYPFGELGDDEKDTVLCAVQDETAPGSTWGQIPGGRFFEDLLAEVVGHFYAHPSAQDEIGYVGMADAKGWEAIGLDRRAAHEPLPAIPRAGAET